MTDREKEELLTMYQINLEILRHYSVVCRHASGDALAEKVIGNLSDILDKLK